MPESPKPDDATLLRRFCASRDEAAFTQLVQRHLPLVFHVALRRLGSHALAEEAAQTAFARLATKAKQVTRHPERLRAWLHRTAHLEACALARKEKRLGRVPIEPQPAPQEMTPRPEIHDRLDEALQRLPELDRELVLRHCCEGQDYARIAPAVGKSAAACQKRVERALALLAKRLGGSRGASAVAADLAARQSHGEAMPAAERVAASALEQSSLASGAAGAALGMKAAACTALAMAGGIIGWQPEQIIEATPPPTRETISTARRATPQPAPHAAPTLAPRPPRIVRPLDEVLETIQAGRFAPLVEFLPHATPADLRAIIAEDDVYEYGEIDGKEHFGTARNLALRRWAEIEPHAAFAFAKERDLEMLGYWLGDTALVLATWAQTDASQAVETLRNLPKRNHVELMESIFQENPRAAETFAAFMPELAWVVEEQHLTNRNRELTRDEAERVVNELLAANRQPASWMEELDIKRSFLLLARFDADDAITRAHAIPWQVLRAEVLVALYQEHPPSPVLLAPGAARAKAVAAEMERHLRTDADAAIRRLREMKPGPDRDAAWQAVARDLPAQDPWRMLELAATLDGPLAPQRQAIVRTLEFAGRTDPQRALKMVPKIAARCDGFDGIRGLIHPVLKGWQRSDPEAAAHAAEKLGIPNPVAYEP